MTTVALLGMPLIHIDGYLIRGPSCEPRASDNPRKDLEQLLVQATPGIEVVDLGEITNTLTETAYRNAPDFDDFGRRVKSAVALSRADVLLVVGGDHSGALPFYGLPGNVARMDAHGDAYVVESQISPFGCQIDNGNYVYHAARQGLKKPEEIWNIGVKYTKAGYYGNGGTFGRRLTAAEVSGMQNVPEFSFSDVDLDVLSQSYGLPHGQQTSDLRAEDLARLITKLKPKIVGVFECVAQDKNGYSFIPGNIVSAHPDVFAPVCKAVAEVAAARSFANLQNPPASSAACR